MKVKLSDIVPNAVFYSVYGRFVSSKTIGSNISRYKIIERDPENPQFFSMFETYKGETRQSYFSHRDRGIFEDDQQPYNLNRLFKTEEDAIKFQKEIVAGVFSDPADQKLFDSDWMTNYVAYLPSWDYEE
ncbi:hypothetical protein POP12_155 [Pectobacterium phage POP12]|nr:hypothetical protein POP12_155 [Pectobacterium phage POP12]